MENPSPPLAPISHDPLPPAPALNGGRQGGLISYPELAPNPLVVLALRLRKERPASESTPVSVTREPAAPETQPRVPVSLAPELPAVRLLACSSAPVALLPPPEPETPKLEPLDAPKQAEEIDPPWATPLSLPAVAPVAAAAKTPAPQPALPAPGPVTWNSLKERAAAPGPALPLAVLEDDRAAVLRKARPAAPSRSVLVPDIGPRITLPGPALPLQLTSLEQAGLARILAPRPRHSAPQSARGWLVSGLVMLALVAVAIGILLVVTPLTPAKPQAPAALHGSDPHGAVPHAVQQAATPAPVSTPPASYSLSKMVEVTGFRFVVDSSKKPEVHYLVVNHSAAELNDVTVFVTLRTTSAKAGQPPLCRFSFRPAGLAGYEAKEMVSPIQKLPPAAALPEWRDLYADVELGP